MSRQNDLVKEEALKQEDLKLKLQAEAANAVQIATTDSLTQILSRVGLERAVNSSLNVCLFETSCRLVNRKSDNRPLSVLMIDIDHFKGVNDTYGHKAGDTVLFEVAQRIKNSVRTDDIMGRYGGEEILVLLPDCDDVSVVTTLCEKIRLSVCSEPVIYRENLKETSIPVTVSLGAALVTAGTLKEGILVADGAMYAAKRNGRNQAVVATDGQGSDELHPSKPISNWRERDRVVVACEPGSPPSRG